MNVLNKIIEENLKFKYTKFGVFKSKQELRTDWIIMPVDVLAYIAEGNGKILFRESNTLYSVEPGEAILSRGGKVRKNLFSPENGKLIVYWMHLRYEIVNSFNLLRLFDFPKVFKDGTAKKIGERLKNLIDLSYSTQASSVSEIGGCKALGMEILALMLKECHLKDDALSLLNQYREFADIIDYIERHINKKITVAELAKKYCLSVSRFHRVFKATTGKAPTEFIIGKRIQKAQSLLVTTKMSLTEISEMTGFVNVYYFSRIFKQYSGITPAAYRRKLINSLVL